MFSAVHSKMLVNIFTNIRTNTNIHMAEEQIIIQLKILQTVNCKKHAYIEISFGKFVTFVSSFWFFFQFTSGLKDYWLK